MPIRREGFSLSSGRVEEDFVGAFGAALRLFFSQRTQNERRGKREERKKKEVRRLLSLTFLPFTSSFFFC